MSIACNAELYLDKDKYQQINNLVKDTIEPN